MKYRILLALVFAFNVALVVVALAPGFVTFAELPPKAIACSVCATPEVQKALAQAASFGRGQIQSMVSSHAWMLFALALASMVAAVGLFLGHKARRSPHAL
ncbi:MAG: hypothetical protein U1D69_00435 [Polynucleobacter sp.]|nr:hypothetical protein [Polynucleobacter sp.]